MKRQRHQGTKGNAEAMSQGIWRARSGRASKHCGAICWLAALAILMAIMPRALEPSDQAGDMGKASQTPQSLRVKTNPTVVEVRYFLFLPRKYDRKSGPRWPLIFFLHGAGERGTNLNAVARHGPPKIVKTKPEFPFVVVSPQCPAGQAWSSDVLLALVREVMKRERIDPDRIYLTGLSMGGFATWDLGLKEPELFAAIAPICGGGDILPILLPEKKKEKALRTLPVWAFHGGKDPVVDPSESKRMVEALHRIKNRAQLTIYENAGHDSWTETYDNPRFYQWLLEQNLRDRQLY